MTASVRHAGDRQMVLSRLQADIRGLDAAGAAATLRQAQADHWISLRQLADHFADHPNAFTEPTPNAPAALLRLCQALRAAGHVSVVEPRCAGCDRPNVRLVSPGPNGRICGTCRSRDYRGACPRCGRRARLVARRDEGVICGSCYDRDPDRMEPCGVCGVSCIPESRAGDGSARCRRCHPRRSHVCTECGRLAPAAVVDAGRPVCYRCYQRPKRRCGRCGRVRIVKRGATIEGPDLCDSCYRGADAVCTVCGRTRPCHGAKSGRPVCASCRPRPRRRCDRCARVRPISAHWPIGAVCSLCYDQVRANPSPCAGCGRTSPLIAGEPDKPTCGPCAGFDVNYDCVGCGHATLLFRDGYCHRCVLTGRLAHLLAGPEQTISPQLAPLTAALAAVDKPHTVLIWLGYSPTARLLVDLAATGQPITHARLDTLKPSKAVHYIRDVLVTAGVLPERDELLERVPPFVDDLLAGQPEIARIIKPYAQWFLVRRTRQRRPQPADQQRRGGQAPRSDTRRGHPAGLACRPEPQPRRTHPRPARAVADRASDPTRRGRQLHHLDQPTPSDRAATRRPPAPLRTAQVPHRPRAHRPAPPLPARPRHPDRVPRRRDPRAPVRPADEPHRPAAHRPDHPHRHGHIPRRRQAPTAATPPSRHPRSRAARLAATLASPGTAPHAVTVAVPRPNPDPTGQHEQDPRRPTPARYHRTRRPEHCPHRAGRRTTRSRSGRPHRNQHQHRGGVEPPGQTRLDRVRRATSTGHPRSTRPSLGRTTDDRLTPPP
jgi:hypothetical protein